MSSIRLFILGALERGGPMHGHQIRRAAQVDRTELWTDFKTGSVYAALPRMAADGTLAISRSEKVGKRPERTVYQITDTGRAELLAVRDAALAAADLRPDVVDLALQNAHDLPASELRRRFERRMATFTAKQIAWQHQWSAASSHISARESLTFAHTLLRLEAEVAWCRTVLDQLDDQAATTPSRTLDDHE